MNQRSRRDPGTRRRTVRLATFNVLHGRALPDGGPLSPAANPAEGPLARAVLSLDADVLPLQELDRLQERSDGADQASVAADASGLKHWRYRTSCAVLQGSAWG
ncbi:hypothetical protein ACFVRU_41890 [Streptomyces sp. NPDC057927]